MPSHSPSGSPRGCQIALAALFGAGLLALGMPSRAAASELAAAAATGRHGADGPVAAGASDPRAIAVAERTMEAMGGKERFAAARLLHFEFAPVRNGRPAPGHRHWWDRQTGAYRLEGRNKEGIAYRVLFDLGTRQGKAWLGERELAGEELAKQLESAYGRFINDTYWLLMPWKWLDPGVILGYEGKQTVDGREYEVVTLRFQNDVGLTSNDRYWAYVSTASGLMERWQFVLETEEGAPGSAAPTPWAWEAWTVTQAGPKLATHRRPLAEGATTTITFPIAELRNDVSEAELQAIFHPTSALPPPLPPPAATPTPAAAPTPAPTTSPKGMR